MTADTVVRRPIADRIGRKGHDDDDGGFSEIPHLIILQLTSTDKRDNDILDPTPVGDQREIDITVSVGDQRDIDIIDPSVISLLERISQKSESVRRWRSGSDFVISVYKKDYKIGATLKRGS